ncbi:conserved hypothetical protein [Ricinus communis]|uniref:Uncharacterized protein n=1 Tax=Ricinus communis TaxID=3988 RepID=B9SQD3_RICCO|nr:conserved hypothetical protein [Ricinus communis]
MPKIMNWLLGLSGVVHVLLCCLGLPYTTKFLVEYFNKLLETQVTVCQAKTGVSFEVTVLLQGRMTKVCAFCIHSFWHS